MTRAEQQQIRYIATPCPRPASRKKLKRLGLKDHKVFEILKRNTKMEYAEKHPIPEQTSDKHNLAAFVAIIKKLGGSYEVFRDKEPTKKHTDGKFRVTLRPVKQMLFDEVANIQRLANGPSGSKYRAKYAGHYYEDMHGCLRKFVP